MTVLMIKGTSGSGKTHLARRIMALYPENGTIEGPSMKSAKGTMAYGHHLRRPPDTGPGLFALGRYDGPACGGCDSFSWKGAADWITSQIFEYHGRGEDVLLEGLMVTTWGSDRVIGLSRALDLRVIQLTTSLEECLASVQARRVERGNDRPLNPENTVAKWRGAQSGSKVIEGAGVKVIWADREAAFDRARGILNL